MYPFSPYAIQKPLRGRIYVARVPKSRPEACDAWRKEACHIAHGARIEKGGLFSNLTVCATQSVITQVLLVLIEEDNIATGAFLAASTGRRGSGLCMLKLLMMTKQTSGTITDQKPPLKSATNTCNHGSRQTFQALRLHRQTRTTKFKTIHSEHTGRLGAQRELNDSKRKLE
ncbi:hypothetical protein IWZ03DRAFT_157048 [Phyllosticta citriasiana]|uniref:Uncharacterized protein n=1 Tax=Phyllosticta citriasiana TaxID=595635 RepID=A0ABR1KPF2_9PEZI